VAGISQSLEAMMAQAPQARAHEKPETWIESDVGTVLEERDVLTTLEKDLNRNDDTRPARGIVNGVIIGTAIWILIIGALMIFV
jgi:hypothetical protein